MPFYQAHALAFLFFLLVAFGSVDGNTLITFHYSLLVAAFGSTLLLGLFMIFWLLYMANGYHSILGYLDKPENQFLYLSGGQNRNTLLPSIAKTIISIDAPIIIYVLIGFAIGLHHGFLLDCFLSMLFLFITLSLQIYLLYTKIQNLHRLPIIKIPSSLFNITFRPSIFSITLRYLFYERKMMLAGVKVFSCLLIYAAHYEWDSFGYDIRWMQIALGPAMAVHGVIMYSIFTFDQEKLGFTRGFPELLWQRYLQQLLLTSLLLLPEAILLLSYSIHFGIESQLSVLVLFMISIPAFQYSVLFTNDFDAENYNGLLFALTLVCFFACLFHFGWLLALLFLIVSFIIFIQSYRLFEKKIS